MRNLQITKLRLLGKSTKELSAKFELSVRRIQEIVKAHRAENLSEIDVNHLLITKIKNGLKILKKGDIGLIEKKAPRKIYEKQQTVRSWVVEHRENKRKETKTARQFWGI